jgi:peptidoglycan hydrolase-like protein with peptidoglycan-binding domain
MNPEATNFNRLANRDDGSCQLPQSQQPTGGETAPQGEVLGAATTEPDLSLPASCGEYLSDYLRYGKKNNPEQVKLLQSFLNEYVEANLPVTGFFGKMTHNAVKKFQVKYHAEIIKPWIDAGYKDKDIENGTGYVFKTTKREINLLKCSSLNIPMPELKAQ